MTTVQVTLPRIPRWFSVLLLVAAVLVGSTFAALNNGSSESITTVNNRQTAPVSVELQQPIVAKVQTNQLPAARIKATTDFLEEYYFTRVNEQAILYQFVKTTANQQANANLVRCFSKVGATVKTKMPNVLYDTFATSWSGVAHTIQARKMTAEEATFLVLFDGGGTVFGQDPEKYKIRFSVETTVRGRFADDKPYISSFVSCKRTS